MNNVLEGDPRIIAKDIMESFLVAPHVVVTDKQLTLPLYQKGTIILIFRLMTSVILSKVCLKVYLVKFSICRISQANTVSAEPKGISPCECISDDSGGQRQKVKGKSKVCEMDVRGGRHTRQDCDHLSKDTARYLSETL